MNMDIPITTLLNELSELQAQRVLLDLDYQAKRDAILGPITQQIADLEEELEPQADALNAQIDRLMSLIKDRVAAEGETVRGQRLQAVFQRGRATWDGRALEGYAAAHPEVLRFRRIGEPSVVIRATG